MQKIIYWDEKAQPINTDFAHLLYELRLDGVESDLLMEPMTAEDIRLDADSVLEFDALVTPYNQLEKKMLILQRVMERAGSDNVKPVTMNIGSPKKRNGVTMVDVLFELSDGQTVTIFFHNPDATPQKLAPTDELISWKWVLNKKDITIVVAPEKGEDLRVQEVARRVMKLAIKNSAAFQRQNERRAARMKEYTQLEESANAQEKQLNEILSQIKNLEGVLAQEKAKNAEVTKKHETWKQEQEQARIRAEAERAKKLAEEERAKQEAEELAKKQAEEKATQEKAKAEQSAVNEDEEFLRKVMEGSVNMDEPTNMDRLEKVAERHLNEDDPLNGLLNDALNAVAEGYVSRARAKVA